MAAARRRALFGTASALYLALACASPWQTQASVAPGADLGAYATFGWLPAGGSLGSEPLSVAEANLRAAVRKQLVGRGYRETDVAPELRIGFETDTRLQERTSPPMQVGVGMGSWGGHVGGGVSTDLPVGSERVKTTATTRITIRAIDPKRSREVWIGSASGEIEPGLDATTVDEVVARVMKEFPARRP